MPSRNTAPGAGLRAGAPGGLRSRVAPCAVRRPPYRPARTRRSEGSAEPGGALVFSLFTPFVGFRTRRSGDPLESPHFVRDRKSTRLNSSHVKISYAVF